MKKSEQLIINAEVLKVYDDVCNLMKKNKYAYLYGEPLRSCNASVFDVQGVKMLRSYDTVVAAICDGVCYDFLRKVYGYTSTSAQHITKFCNDYHAYKKLTYKD